jgi:hypothetical protein
MDPGFRSPLVDRFRRGDVARDIRLMAAEGALVPRAEEQLALLVLLSDDADADVAHCANATLDALPAAALEAFLARPDVPVPMREFFMFRGVRAGAEPPTRAAEPPIPAAAPPVDTAAPDEELLAQVLAEAADVKPGDEAEGEDDEEASDQPISSMSIVQRMKLAMKGGKSHRSMLIRDPNKLVAAAVLGSPKLTETEVETFAKMANVSEEVLRTIANNRTWTKNYGVISGLARNPKTPPAISMQMVPRLNQRDLKTLSQDRNVPEVVRNTARRIFKKELL